MSALTDRLAKFSAAEDFLNFFEIRFDEHVVHVNRLHILKRFYQYLRAEPGLARMEEEPMFACYRRLLQQAHDDFLKSSAAQEKVFKVFQDAEAKSFSLDKLSGTLPSRSA